MLRKLIEALGWPERKVGTGGTVEIVACPLFTPIHRTFGPCSAGLGASSAGTSFCMQLQPKCADDFKDGVEIRATITGERFVETFARQPGIACDL